MLCISGAMEGVTGLEKKGGSFAQPLSYFEALQGSQNRTSYESSNPRVRAVDFETLLLRSSPFHIFGAPTNQEWSHVSASASKDRQLEDYGVKGLHSAARWLVFCEELGSFFLTTSVWLLGSFFVIGGMAMAVWQWCCRLRSAAAGFFVGFRCRSK